jgi:DNA-binding response OmpR family regulator
MKSDILIIMQAAEIEALGQILMTEGFTIERATNVEAGIERAQSGGLVLAILDAAPLLPGAINGIEALRQIRHRLLLPVLMISAEPSDAERILALELGADDYMPRPFLSQELTARVRSILRRSSAGVSAFRHLLQVGDLALNRMRRTVSQGGVEIALTAAEFDLLELLLKRVGQVVAREEIAQLVLGRALGDNDRSIDVHISNLRRKLGDAGTGRIKALRAAGYSFTIS